MDEQNVGMKLKDLENGIPEGDCPRQYIPEGCHVWGLMAHVTPGQGGQTLRRTSQRGEHWSWRPWA